MGDIKGVECINFMDIKLLEKYKKKQEGAPPHELSASVNEIEKVIPFTSKYGRGYWLAQVKRSGKAYPEILGILKNIEKMDKKYSKGGTLTNQLKK
jgi:hypothetical protein